MLFEILVHINNLFPTNISEEALYTIEDGAISLPFIADNQYYLIEGSVFNDGVHKRGAEELTDEVFNGCITGLAIPKAFLSLVDEIEAYNAKNEASALTSESFGGYSYSKATGSNGTVASWQEVFASRLNTWRRL